MIEQNAFLKRYITNAPASAKEHTEAIGWLNDIHKHYDNELEVRNKRIRDLEAKVRENDALKSEQKKGDNNAVKASTEKKPADK